MVNRTTFEFDSVMIVNAEFINNIFIMIIGILVLVISTMLGDGYKIVWYIGCIIIGWAIGRGVVRSWN